MGQITAVLLAGGLIVSSVSCSKAKWEVVSTAKFSDAAPVLSVEFLDGQHGGIATSAGLAETVDGGRTWSERRDIGDGFVFQLLRFRSPGNGWAFGAALEGETKVSRVLNTLDGGLSWIARESGGTGLITSADFCSSQFALAAAEGSLLVSRDDGLHWPTSFSLKTSGGHLWGVACTGVSEAVAVGRNGMVVRTTDAGASWTAVRVETTRHLTRAYYDGVLTWILGENGTLLVSGDKGETWQARSASTEETLLDIKLSGSNGWIVGTRGLILESTDSGGTWERVPSPVTSDLAAISARASCEVWIGGEGFTILKRRC